MSKDAILKIRETEEKAEAIVADARKEAKARVDEAREKGLFLREDIERKGTLFLKRRQEAMQKEREETFAKSEQDAFSEIEELRKDASLKKKSAERIVLRGLEDKCR